MVVAMVWVVVMAMMSASMMAQTTTLLLWPDGTPEASKVVGPEVATTDGYGFG